MGMVKSAIPIIVASALCGVFPAPAGAGFGFFDPENPSNVPTLLSATGFYDNIGAKQVTAGAVPFEINTPEWTDGVGKRRWVILKPGTRITYKDTTDYYQYPDGAVFVLEFALDTVPGDTASRRRLETRLLVLKKDAVDNLDKWYGFSYRWNRQGTNASLVDTLAGARDAIRYYPDGRNRPAKLKKWVFPSQNQCNYCHVNTNRDIQARGVLGFFTAQLNRDIRGANNQPTNQLAHLFDTGVFANLTPRPDFNLAPRWASPGDGAASLDLRARSYLAANCSGCHGDRGIKNFANGHSSRVNFDYWDMKKPEELGTQRVGALEYQDAVHGNPATFDSNRIVYPGHPEYSAIIWRLEGKSDSVPPADTSMWPVDPAFDISPEMMPPLGRYEVDSQGVALLSAWINSLPLNVPVPTVPGAPGSLRSRGATPRVSGNLVHLEGVKDLPARAWLVDLRGSRHLLWGAGPGRYLLPSDSAPGVHHLALGDGRSFRILLP